MIERKIIKDKLKEFMIGEYISTSLERVEHSHTFVNKTPLGEKIVIHSARPGLIVGPKGSNIKKMTKILKSKFKLENPQIEIEEVLDRSTNAQLVAEYIAGTLERFGTGSFKGVGYRTMNNAIESGAIGVEILISGKVPSSRSRTWRFYMGYLKKCGDIAVTGVRTAYAVAKLKTGVVGIQVRIMPPDLVLPDSVKLQSELVVEEEERPATEEEQEKPKKEAKKAPAKKIAKEKPKKEVKEAEPEPEEKPEKEAAETQASAEDAEKSAEEKDEA